MPTLNQTLLTLHDKMKRTDPNGALAPIIETLDRETPELQVLPFREGNLPTGHIFTSRTGLPSVEFRRFNQGVLPTKSKTDQITETTGMVSGLSVVDASLAELNGDALAFRFTEDVAFMESFSQKFGESFFYSSTDTAPEAVMGLTPRFDDLNGKVKRQIVNFGAAGSNTNTSIWGVVLGERGVYGITPKGSPTGLQHYDLGQDMEDDGSGTGRRFRAYRTNWEWHFGFAVADWRKVVRVCNIDVTALSKTNDDLLPALTTAYWRLYKPNSGGRLVWFCNRTIAEYLEHQARSAVKSGGQLNYGVVDGQEVLRFRQAPIMVTDSLIDTEAAVS